MLRRAVVALFVSAALAASASAATPEVTVSGPNGKWFTGSLIQQTGLNCSTAILGEPYTEVMVSGYAAYGGAPNGDVVRVGTGYWAALTLAIPGNPCGTGSSAVATEVILPPNTVVDASRPIRCFGQPRGATDWVELTGGQWSAFGQSGPYCPAQVGPAVYTQGAVGVGFRPLANGQLFTIMVPVVSSSQLVGMGDFNHRFMWTTTATGVYANPGLSSAWVNVFPASNAGSSPFVYFARDPAAQPFWLESAGAGPPDLRNRVEFWANFYTAGQGGTVSFQVRRLDNNALAWDSTTDPTFNGTVAPGQNIVQILPTGNAVGPNGGYSPIAFDPPGEWGVPMRVTWTFTPTSGPAVSNSADFTTLTGPDGDGDGVADSADACPAVKGTLSNGCLPAPLTDPDGDGVFGAADLCPTASGAGSLNGCPPATIDARPPLTVGTKANTVLRAVTLAKGLRIPITCNRATKVTLTIVVSKKLAKSRLKIAAPAKGLVVATGTGTCTAGAALKVKVVSKKTLRKKLAALKTPLPASLVTTLPSPAVSPKAIPVRLKK